MNLTTQIKWWKEDVHFNVSLYQRELQELKNKEGLSTSSRVKDVSIIKIV